MMSFPCRAKRVKNSYQAACCKVLLGHLFWDMSQTKAIYCGVDNLKNIIECYLPLYADFNLMSVFSNSHA